MNRRLFLKALPAVALTPAFPLPSGLSVLGRSASTRGAMKVANFAHHYGSHVRFDPQIVVRVKKALEDLKVLSVDRR